MASLKWDLKACEWCIQANQSDPAKVPCRQLRGPSADTMIFVPQKLVQYTCCPFTASWEDVKSAATGSLGTIRHQWANQELAVIRSKLGRYANSPMDCGYLKGVDPNNNPHTHVLPDRRLMVWLRRLPADKEREFSAWFFANGLDKPIGQMTTTEKLLASATLATTMLPAEGRKLVQDLMSSIPVLVAILGALALSPQKYVAFFRALFYGFGIASQIKDYMSSFGKWLAYAGGATQYSQLKEGAQALAHVMAMGIADLGLVGMERFISFLKAKSAREYENAAHKGGYDETSAGGNAPVAAKPKPAGVAIRRLNFNVKGVKKVTKGADVQLLETEMAGYREISKLEGGTCMVVREASKSRLSWLERKLSARSKIEKVKAKSLKGDLPEELKPLGGLLALDEIPAANLKGTGRKWNPTHPDLAHLKGKPIYEVTSGAKIEGIKGDALWKEFAVVDLGVVGGQRKFLIIDKFWEHPMIPDVDVAAICPAGGGTVRAPDTEWLNGMVPQGLRGNIMGADDAVRGGILNRIMQKHTGDQFYTHFEHSDFGGSAIFKGKDGRPVWKEPIKDERTQNEALVMFLNGECYRFDNWRVYRRWCLDNGVEFMCPWEIPI